MNDKPYVASQFLSIFSWGRPPVPWDIADVINMEIRKRDVKSIGVTGSLSPSVLTSIGFDNQIELNCFASHSLWEEGLGWQYVIEDSPGMEKEVPWPKTYLPVENVHIWDGATPFFSSEAIFTDLPFAHDAVRLNIEFLDKSPGSDVERSRYRVILLGFLEGCDGPDDVLNWALDKGYGTTEHRAVIKNQETGEALEYRLIVASDL